MSVLQDQNLERLLAGLHARSDEQIPAVTVFRADRPDGSRPTEEEEKTFLSDKFYALDRDKAEFCYQLCRSGNARRIVEVGTSYGVSTLYLAAALRDNIAAYGGEGIVIGTEYEPAKARAARANFAAGGLSHFIELREGDLRQTLRALPGPVDFVLVDIWAQMARPALELVYPYLRAGAIVVCDNTQIRRAHYADYFAFLTDPARGFRTMTLPFDGGFELSVRC